MIPFYFLLLKFLLSALAQSEDKNANVLYFI